MKKTVALVSGGMDSVTLLHHLVNGGHEVRALGVDYGQRHVRELACAEEVCRRLNVPFTTVHFDQLAAILPGSSQTDTGIAVPEGKYDEESMKATVVPNRNMILLSIAIGHAIAHKFDSVAYAAHAGDHTIYPDCRPEFAQVMAKAATLCDWISIDLHRPFIHMSKADIVLLGADIGVDFSLTHSCYKGEKVHCGKCGTCIERREAFYLAGIHDPTEYTPDAPSVAALVANGWHLPK